MPDDNTLLRLRAIISRIEQRQSRGAHAESKEDSPGDKDLSEEWLSSTVDCLGLRREDTPHGPVVYREDEFPLGHRYGEVSIATGYGDASTFALLANDEGFAPFSPEHALFLDIETTGLSHGTGTLAFLVGLAQYTGSSLITRQFLLTDYGGERAMLEHISHLFSGAQWLVTFNGRSFDVPILETRYTMNRLRCPFSSAENFDLLHGARRLWKDAHPCNLKALEEAVLRHEREDDVPGALIPTLYFEYLRTRRPDLILPVVTHNRFDLVAMAALLSRMSSHVKCLRTGNLKSQELYNLGKLLEKAGRLDESAFCYREAPNKDGAEQSGTRALKRLARLEKRRGNYMEALSILRKAVETDSQCLDAHVELAKILEHQVKDYRSAAECCDAALMALDRLTLLSPSSSYRALLELLRKRRERLARKHAAHPCQ